MLFFFNVLRLPSLVRLLFEEKRRAAAGGQAINQQQTSQRFLAYTNMECGNAQLTKTITDHGERGLMCAVDGVCVISVPVEVL